jgi:hypothetical protein
MNDYPKKLAAYLDTLDPDQRSLREELYRTTLAQAIEHRLQSPRFWAARQVITGLSASQIQHKIQKRIRRIPRDSASDSAAPAPQDRTSGPVRRRLRGAPSR